MGILYHFLHQCIAVWRPISQRPIKRLGFFRRKRPAPEANAMLSLYNLARNRDLNRAHSWGLDFMAKYFNGFLFFKVRPFPSRKPAKTAPLSFREFKESYRGLLVLDIQSRLPVTSKRSAKWTAPMFGFFRYLFVDKYVITTMSLLRASLNLGHMVSRRELTYAVVTSISHVDFAQETAKLSWVNQSHPEDFVLTVFNSSSISTVLNDSNLGHDTITLSSSQSTAGHPLTTPLVTTQEVAERSKALADVQSVVFHRYSLPLQKSNPQSAVHVRGFLNTLYNKGRTPRNKQIYRTGVFWCLWLTVLTVVGPFYVFYGFTFAYTHLYIFPLAILFRAACVALARFFDITAKQLWLSFLSRF